MYDVEEVQKLTWIYIFTYVCVRAFAHYKRCKCAYTRRPVVNRFKRAQTSRCKKEAYIEFHVVSLFQQLT